MDDTFATRREYKPRFAGEWAQYLLSDIEPAQYVQPNQPASSQLSSDPTYRTCPGGPLPSSDRPSPTRLLFSEQRTQLVIWWLYVVVESRCSPSVLWPVVRQLLRAPRAILARVLDYLKALEAKEPDPWVRDDIRIARGIVRSVMRLKRRETQSADHYVAAFREYFGKVPAKALPLFEGYYRWQRGPDWKPEVFVEHVGWVATPQEIRKQQRSPKSPAKKSIAPVKREKEKVYA